MSQHNSRDVGMATARPHGFKTDFSKNSFFLDQLLDFLLLYWNSFFNQFLKSEFPKKIFRHQNNFIFEGWYSSINVD